MLLLMMFCALVVGTVAGSVYKALIDEDLTAVKSILVHVTVLYSLNVMLLTLVEWCRGMFAVMWRKRVVSIIQEKYCTGHGFAVVCGSLDNTDQRMTSEAANACAVLSSLLKKIAASPLKIIYFGYTAGTYIGITGVLTVFIFFLVSIIFQKFAALPLAKSIASREKEEGFYRWKHMRLKNMWMDIATQGDMSAEDSALQEQFSATLLAQKQVVKRETILTGVTRGVDYFGSVLNYILIAAAVLFRDKNGEGSAGGKTAEFVSNASFFSLSLVNAFTELVDMGQDISTLSALMYRIYNMVEYIDQASEPLKKTKEDTAAASNELKRTSTLEDKSHCSISCYSTSIFSLIASLFLLFQI